VGERLASQHSMTTGKVTAFGPNGLLLKVTAFWDAEGLEADEIRATGQYLIWHRALRPGRSGERVLSGRAA
jgi:hypothetical protein